MKNDFGIIVCMSAIDDCQNLDESYGEINMRSLQ